MDTGNDTDRLIQILIASGVITILIPVIQDKKTLHKVVYLEKPPGSFV